MILMKDICFVGIEFNKEGGKAFSDITATNVGKRLAIVLDGTVYSAPVIREKIPSGRGQITGNFSVQEASDLAIVLRAGALPAPVHSRLGVSRRSASTVGISSPAAQ